MLAVGWLVLGLLVPGEVPPSAPGGDPVGAAAGAPAEARAVPAPRLAVGDELHYVGEVVEASERFDNRFRKRYDLEARLLVLESGAHYADCALLTRLRPRLDPVIVAGALDAPAGAPASVRVDLVRIDNRGRVLRLLPPFGPPPLPLGAGATTAPLAGPALDGPPLTECGFVVPLPGKLAAVGAPWDTPDGDRPPVAWAASGDALWNGGRCLEVRGAQQSDGYDRPGESRTGWRRAERVLLSPADGTACTVERRTERRQGSAVVGWVEVKYELRPSARLVGARLAEARHEAETAHALTAELAALTARRAPAAEFKSRALKAQRFLDDHPAGGFREAIESLRRRYLSLAAGEGLPTAVVTAAPRPAAPVLGRAAPDFVAPHAHEVQQARLSAHRGRPCVLAFYRPDSKTSAGALAVAEALHAQFAGRATVFCVAILEEPAAAARQREALRLTLTVLDGRAVRATYAVETYPRFFVLDQAGTLVWQFDGYGPEVGYLLRERLEGLLPARAEGGPPP